MATNFKVWISDNEMSGAEIEDSITSGQLKTGFKAGTAASASWANTGLREATLLTTALAEMLTLNGLTHKSTLSSVQTAMTTNMNSFIETKSQSLITTNINNLVSAVVQSIAANELSSTSGRTYAIQKDSNGKLVVNIPWIGTVTGVNLNSQTISPVNGIVNIGNLVVSNNTISGATKCKITYDNKGLVTAGADLAASDIPNLPTSQITGLANYPTPVSYLTSAPTADNPYGLIVVKLSSEPATKYNGYIYMIEE